MFDKVAVCVSQTDTSALAASNDRLAKTLRENSEREIAARDRVDITLEEYTKMKKDIENLTEENRMLKTLFGKIGLPYNVPIIPGSIRKYIDSGTNGFMDFTQGFLIRFKCDMSTMSPGQRDYMTEHFLKEN